MPPQYKNNIFWISKNDNSRNYAKIDGDLRNVRLVIVWGLTTISLSSTKDETINIRIYYLEKNVFNVRKHIVLISSSPLRCGNLQNGHEIITRTQFKNPAILMRRSSLQITISRF